jgi:hypothetical protein
MTALSVQFRGRGTRHLYHFTDASNLSLIRQHGLLSVTELNRRGMRPPAPGGNQWSRDADAMAGVDGYVHLCYLPNHPMCFVASQDGRIPSPTWLAIDPSILDLPGVLFTFDVANKSGVAPVIGAVAVGQLDAEVLYTHTDWNDPVIYARRQAAEKAEVLIPTHVPIGYITGL